MSRLNDALKNRVIIYSGGGSTYSKLRSAIYPFTDIKQISPNVWKGMTVDEIADMAKLCPIISTSLGLAISEDDDKVKISNIGEIFSHLRYIPEEDPEDKVRPAWVLRY